MKMGKRKKIHEKSEKNASVKENTFDCSQISIGEEFKRWTTVRESMCLSDEQLMKAILDLYVFTGSSSISFYEKLAAL